jgi:hypothetical protein
VTRRPSGLVVPGPPAACAPSGEHWHRLVDWTATTDPARPELGQYAILHDWIRSTGHPTPKDPRRPHAHRWQGPELRRHLANALAGPMLEVAVRTMDGLWMTGPSVAERPSQLTDWLDNEDAIAMTLHPELRPARLRDN